MQRKCNGKPLFVGFLFGGCWAFCCTYCEQGHRESEYPGLNLTDIIFVECNESYYYIVDTDDLRK